MSEGFRRAAAVVGLLSLLMTACFTSSEVDPDERIVIRGSVTRADVGPVPGTRVSFSKAGDLGEALTVGFSFGLACFDPDAPQICEGERVTTVADDGTYRFDLRGADTQGLGRSASTLYLTARFDPIGPEVVGPVTNLRFIAQTERITLPVRAWQTIFETESDARSVTLGWDRLPSDLPPASVRPERTSVVFEDATGALVWQQPASNGSAEVDLRLLEDMRGIVAATAHADDAPVSAEHGTKLGYTIRTGSAAFNGTAGAPLSRGRPCSTEERPRPMNFITPCPATDGVFSQPDSADDSEFLTVNLRSRQPLRLIVIRGCLGECRVQHSRNARDWTTIGTGTAPVFAIEPDRPPRAQFLRVRSDIGAPSEISVWNVSEAPFTPAAAEPIEAVPPIQSDAGAGGAPWMVLIALVVLAAFGALIVYQVRSARRRRAHAAGGRE